MNFCAVEVGAVASLGDPKMNSVRPKTEAAVAMMLALFAVSCETSQRPRRAEELAVFAPKTKRRAVR